MPLELRPHIRLTALQESACAYTTAKIPAYMQAKTPREPRNWTILFARSNPMLRHLPNTSSAPHRRRMTAALSTMSNADTCPDLFRMLYKLKSCILNPSEWPSVKTHRKSVLSISRTTCRANPSHMWGPLCSADRPGRARRTYVPKGWQQGRPGHGRPPSRDLLRSRKLSLHWADEAAGASTAGKQTHPAHSVAIARILAAVPARSK